MYELEFPMCCRVEGQGSAVILDVVHYTSVETKSECSKVLVSMVR